MEKEGVQACLPPLGLLLWHSSVGSAADARKCQRAGILTTRGLGCYIWFEFILVQDELFVIFADFYSVDVKDFGPSIQR